MYHKLRKAALNALTKTPLEAPARTLYGTLVRTKGNRYDKQTFDLMRKVLSQSSNCIDVGAYRGEILKQICKISPNGKHYAFEPVPENYEFLVKKFPVVNTYNLALGEKKNKASFQHVVGRAARSGLLKVEYPDENQELIEIQVKINALDNVIPKETTIRLIKIDVEGAELGVFKGAKELIIKDKPYIIFEHDEKSKIYNTSSAQLYELLDELGMRVCLIKDYLNSENSKLSKKAFVNLVEDGIDSYFLARAK